MIRSILTSVFFSFMLLAFLIGLLIGSFLNVCIYRLPRDLSLSKPARSFCPKCERTIAWYDNIPVLSFLLLRGRCRHCQTRIPLRYPLVELATGTAFALCVAALGMTPAALKYCIFSAILIDLIASDLEERILPDEFTLGGTALGLLLAAWVPMDPGIMGFLLPSSLGPRWISVAESALGAAVCCGAIWFVGWAYEKLRHREGMGFGDVKMIAMIGAFLGLRLTLLTLIAGSLLGAVGGGAYILLARKKASTYELPFGSFLGAAAFLVALAGPLSLFVIGLN
ncbi:MAG TPA: prepilin peptidase [Bryobacteraceae bacterium]|nr:prepilin peptidase [Bryobacteraceae bacterium]